MHKGTRPLIFSPYLPPELSIPAKVTYTIPVPTLALNLTTHNVKESRMFVQSILAHIFFVGVLALHLFIAMVRCPSKGGHRGLHRMNQLAILLITGIYMISILVVDLRAFPPRLAPLLANRGLLFPLMVGFAYLVLGGIPLLAYFKELEELRRERRVK